LVQGKGGKMLNERMKIQETGMKIKELQETAKKLTLRYDLCLAEDPKIPQITKEFIKKINELTQGYSESFEEQRKNIGKTFGIGNTIRQLSHLGILALIYNDGQTVSEIRQLNFTAWNLLKELEVPADIAWDLDSQNGQEMVEFEVLVPLYPLLVNKENVNCLPDIPSAKSLDVTAQAWLAGLGDAVTELGKIHRERMGQHGLKKSERVARRERYVAIAKGIRIALRKFEVTYAQVINNSRRKGFGNTFRGLLGRIDGVIEREMDKIADMLDDLAE
jgi:predicted translin family RNA/ssDNA-binding protein